MVDNPFPSLNFDLCRTNSAIQAKKAPDQVAWIPPQVLQGPEDLFSAFVPNHSFPERQPQRHLINQCF